MARSFGFEQSRINTAAANWINLWHIRLKSSPQLARYNSWRINFKSAPHRRDKLRRLLASSIIVIGRQVVESAGLVTVRNEELEKLHRLHCGESDPPNERVYLGMPFVSMRNVPPS